MEEITGAGTTNLEAHDNYLRAHNLMLSPNQNAEVYRRTIEYGERAVELDPSYAQAHSVLGVCQVFDSINHWSDDDPQVALAKGAEYAARAAELDPNDPEQT